MDAQKARTRFTELRGQRDINPAELDEIWAALDTVRVEDILGSWKGDEFHTGHR
ncbi:GXWXG domain-containing protein, partial [Mycobacteroides abscessus subsp. massiliense]